MNNTDLPPVPRAGESGPQVCATIRLYLAILDDLSPEQVNQVFRHVSICQDCTAEYRLMNSATNLVAHLPTTSPSARVDAVIMALATQTARKRAQPRKLVRPVRPRRRPMWLIGQLAVAVVLLIGLLTATHFIGLAPGPQTFQLPPTLSWSGYVLHHTQTMTGANGMIYQVDSYHDLGTDRMHVETMADGEVDVVAVGDHHAMLGKDMIHHVAQWGADAWAVDDSIFDLAQLRHDLQTKAAVYLDKDNFKGQEVYRIRYQGGLVLLLGMNYLPVNVLQGATGPGTGEPMYNTLELMPASQVAASMWDMSIPAGFQMGTLPAKP